MAVDKLVDSTQLDADLTSVANAIRTKGGTSASLAFPADFVSAIADIPSGGGGGTPVWNRPSDWPNIDDLNISGDNIFYMTYSADVATGFCDITCKTSSGQYKVEVGTVSGSTFTAETSYSINSNTACRHYFGSALGGYKVLRITAVSGDLTSIALYSTGFNSYDGQYRMGYNQGLLEVRAKATKITSINFRGTLSVQHIYMYGSSCENFGQTAFRECMSLILAELPYLVTKTTTDIRWMFYGSANLKRVDMTGWDTSNVTQLAEVFFGCNRLEEVDVSGWDTGKVTSFQGVFQACNLLRTVDISGWDMSSATTAQRLFYECRGLTGSIVIPASVPDVAQQMFNGTRQIVEYHFRSTTPPTMTNTNAFANMTDAGGKKIYVPYSADHSVLNAYKTATNWSTYASYIYEEAA